MHARDAMPLFHISGHIHESRGAARATAREMDSGAEQVPLPAELAAAVNAPMRTTFVSASSVNLLYRLRREEFAIVADVPVKELRAQRH
jgi:hypothetical protein